MPIETRPPSAILETPTSAGRPWQEHALQILWLMMLGLSLLDLDAHTLYALQTATILGSLTLHVSMRPWSFRLVMVSQLAFLTIFVGELFGEYEVLRHVTSDAYIDLAAGYTSAAFAALMTGYWLIFTELHPSLQVHATTPRAMLAHRSDTLVVLVFAVMFVIFFADFGRLAVTVALYGRQRATYATDAFGVIQSGLSSAAGVALPALLGHWILFVRRRSVWVLMLAISPVLLTHFASGTRFYLLFSVVSPLVMIYAGRRVGILVVARTVVVGLGLVIVAGIARTLRGFGYTGTSTIELDTLQVALAQSEGVVLINAQLIDYFQRFDHLGGRSLASMLLFWIPRQVWPDKPTLIGFWFPRAYGIKVESGFSAAAGFCGDAYADFGFTGGLLVCGLAGIALAMTEARVASWLIRREESAALGAIFFGGAFFGMRSPDTTFIMLMGATFWWFTYLGAFRLARVRGPVIDY